MSNHELNTTPEPELRAPAPNAALQTPMSEQQAAKISALGSSCFTSPAGKNPSAVELPERDIDPKALERYLKHAATLGGVKSNITYIELLKRLDLLSSYRDFKAKTDELFLTISQQAIAFDDGQLCYTEERSVNASEKLLVKCFKDICTALEKTDYSKYPLAKPSAEYTLVDHQRKTIVDSTVKPDIVFYYPDRPRPCISDVHFVMEAKKEMVVTLSGEYLGQLADYAHQLWKVQPTRKFVPVFFLNSCILSLVIFARDGCHRIELGSIFRKKVDTDSNPDKAVANTLSKFWFLAVQAPDKFGHASDASVDESSFRFNGTALSTTMQAVDELQIVDDDDLDCNPIVTIGKRIDRSVRLIGHLGHVYRVKYGDKRAILKLSWMKPDKFPEGAVYEALEQNGVNGIPAVYSSGILCKEFFGYRLEYLLLEDCGETLWDIIKKSIDNRITRETIYELIPKVVKSAMNHLLQACSAGVMHRDISSGNISVRDNDVYIIDWGYSKLVAKDHEKLRDRFETLATKWGFDLAAVVKKEKTRDPFTGTHEYMSIRVLSGKTERNIFDDMESLFYVVIHMLQCVEKGKITDFLDTRCLPNNIAAHMKAAVMGNRKYYHKAAGIDTCPNDLLQMLDQMYDMIFMVDGSNVCSELIFGIPEMRKLDPRLLRSILGKETFNNILAHHAPVACDNGIVPSCIAVVSAFSEPESTETPTTSKKRKSACDDDDQADKRVKKSGL
ncbi:hypothetical protein H4R99_000155 [Coemansia sp. RSA 1722]|nr:hypothetical protein H4R99_000155 [Coemansia sp. RSA 1722]